jgi:Protein of unknown function (DUF3987)
LDVYLKGHAGDDLRVDRIGRKSDKVRNPALTCGLAVQPDVLQGLADKPGFRGRGLLGRFLYSMPKDFLGTRTPRPGTVEKNVTETYTRKVRYLLGLSPKTVVGERESHTLYFDTEAQTELETFMTWLEPLLAEGAELGHMTDWAGKLAGAVVRIAGILHMMDTAGKIHPWEIEVGADAVRRAIRIGHYLILHAEYALAFMGTDRTVEDAKYILKWIERKSCEWFTRREAWQDTKRRFDTVADLEGGLRVLVEHGYIREDPRESYERRGPGRKPSPRYEVNPFTVRAEVKGE